MQKPFEVQNVIDLYVSGIPEVKNVYGLYSAGSPENEEYKANQSGTQNGSDPQILWFRVQYISNTASTEYPSMQVVDDSPSRLF